MCAEQTEPELDLAPHWDAPLDHPQPGRHAGQRAAPVLHVSADVVKRPGVSGASPHAGHD